MKIEEIAKGFVLGVLAGFIILYSLQPQTKNPDWLFVIHENPWLLVVILILAYYSMKWDTRIGYFLMIICIAIYLDIVLIIKKIDDKVIKKVITFDIFEGQNIPEGKKSVAINVVIQSQDKTLTESDLDQISQKIINTVKEKTGAAIRS